MKSVTIYTTSECNLRCKHCAVGMDQYKPRKPQTTDELKKIISEIAKGGAQFITILGGEATIYRNDLNEILSHAHEAGIKVTINTNLTSFKAVEPLLDNPGLNSFVVSLDGASPETHDKMRGRGTFKKTTDNIRLIGQHDRVKNRSLFIEIAHVISGFNFHEAGKLLPLSLELGVHHLNVKHVRVMGRAEKFESDLVFDRKKMLEAYCKIIVGWMLSKDKIDLGIFVPPAFGEYLNKRFGLNFPTTERAACGGASVFSYVDLYGNHLPCPSMSYEEDMEHGVIGKEKSFNLIDGSIENSFDSEVFTQFEKNRVERNYTSQLFPCKFCKYNTQCRQCVADIISGAETATVDICAAVFDHGNDDVNGIKSDIWTKLPAHKIQIPVESTL